MTLLGIDMYLRTTGLRDDAIASWEIGNLGDPAAPANKFDQCQQPQKDAIEAVFLRARTLVNRAAAVLGTGYGRPDRMTQRTRDLLNRHFHTTKRDDVLRIFRTIFRIQQAFDKGLKFECETNCKGGTQPQQCGYAWATQWFGGRGDIHICFDSRAGYCSFMGLSDRAQAALIIHEAAHRHVGIDDKAYEWHRTPPNPKDYTKLTPKEATDNADSYAWFCVDL